MRVGHAGHDARHAASAHVPSLACRLVERFLMDGYEPRQDSTYALTLYRHDAVIGGKEVRACVLALAARDACHPIVACCVGMIDAKEVRERARCGTPLEQPCACRARAMLMPREHIL